MPGLVFFFFEMESPVAQAWVERKGIASRIHGYRQSQQLFRGLDLNLCLPEAWPVILLGIKCYIQLEVKLYYVVMEKSA